MKNKNYLIVLVGLPGTGKSTFRARLQKDDGLEFETISSDDYIETRAKALGKTYSEVFSETIGDANDAVEFQAKHYKNYSRNVVWDQTNLTAKKRKKILDKFPDYVKIAVHFELMNTYEWLKRLYKRAGEEGKYIPFHVLESMHRSFEMPGYDEGFDYVSDGYDFSTVVVKMLCNKES